MMDDRLKDESGARGRVDSAGASGLLRIAIPAILSAISLIPFGISFAQDDETYESDIREDDVRFVAVDLWIDAHHHALAAWQIEFDAPGNVEIVGIENGDFAADPPHYDPAAMMNNRAILAQYSLDDDLHAHAGEMRVATLHLRVEGELDVDGIGLELAAAANTRGERIGNAEVRLERRDDE